jgi:hypothetical protein
VRSGAGTDAQAAICSDSKIAPICRSIVGVLVTESDAEDVDLRGAQTTA